MKEELEERAGRIVQTAIELAEEGGFEAVRLRDVASHAGVALGTLYRRFRSKEDLLVAALEQETSELEQRILERPPKGDDELERIVAYFGIVTRALCRRPNLARALLKAAASGEQALAKRIASFHDRMEHLIIFSIRGDGSAEDPSELERRLANSLELVWFAMVMGWTGGLHSQTQVIDQMQCSAELLLYGAQGPPSGGGTS